MSSTECEKACKQCFELVFPDESHEKEYFAMMDEWISFGGRLYPGALRLKGLKKYAHWLQKVRDECTDKESFRGKVPQTTYFLMGEDRIYGAVSIRNDLNKGLLKTGGHIGYGIRPSERRRGYATAMLGLALHKCRELGIMRVLVTCDKDNIASAKVIQKNGGVLENEVPDEKGMPVQRYWIDIR
jgi:predicted acetyltransferase